MGRLDGKVAIVTGAASGMGRATALLFAAEGARVVVADISDDAGAAVVTQCEGAGGAAIYHRTDVTSEHDMKDVVAQAVATFGGLDIFHSHAGGGGGIGFEETAEWDQGYTLGLRPGYLAIKYSAPEMARRGGGSIILTSSAAGFRPVPQAHAYNVFKGALMTLAESAAQTLAPDYVRVNAIAPGLIVTPMTIGGMGVEEDDAKRIFSKGQPIPRHGTPEDVANCALFLASDESSFITGITIPVDGGSLVQSVRSPEFHAELAAVAARKREQAASD